MKTDQAIREYLRFYKCRKVPDHILQSDEATISKFFNFIRPLLKGKKNEKT